MKKIFLDTNILLDAAILQKADDFKTSSNIKVPSTVVVIVL